MSRHRCAVRLVNGFPTCLDPCQDKPLTGKKADVIKAAHLCAEAALRLVKPGNKVLSHHWRLLMSTVTPRFADGKPHSVSPNRTHRSHKPGTRSQSRSTATPSRVSADQRRPGHQSLPVACFVEGNLTWFVSCAGMLSHQLKQHVIDGEKTIIQNPTDQQK